MILALMLLQAADLPPVPADWAVLAPMPYAEKPQLSDPLVQFVASEVAAGRCTPPRPADGHYIIRVDVATLVAADGTVRRTVPHAIDCPTVEQYTAGLIISFARGNIQSRAGAGDTWYRATFVFDWQG